MLPKAGPHVAQVIKLANVIAREYEREYVGTEHLLLAIRREGKGMGAQVLAGRHLSETLLKEEIDKLIKSQMEETWVFGRLPGTPHFKNVMAKAVEECQNLRAKEIRTEHLLLALLKERGCVAFKALDALGVTYEAARDAVGAAASS